MHVPVWWADMFWGGEGVQVKEVMRAYIAALAKNRT
jgi:hypothetical protein